MTSGTGFEADAMRAVVDDYNASQDHVRIDYSSVSQINRKVMLATAGGVPPDVAGLFGEDIPVYAENNALTPLDRPVAAAGMKREDYVDVYWQICSHRGVLFALPATPNVLALIWNKKMFREAGLDPEQPPRSIAELEAFNEKILRRRPDGSIERIGHLPNEPFWSVSLRGFWFGAKFWDGQTKIEADAPENVAALPVDAILSERFGAQSLLALRDGFGTFASSQDPFMSGQVAMTLQGVWIYNFIKNYAPPDFEWGVAAFPSVDPDRLKDVTLAGTDVLVVPAGGKHQKEAFEFLRYVNSQGPMEKLCLGQRKFSPLRRVSDEFYRQHPDPYIRKYVELANSPNAHLPPADHDLERVQRRSRRRTDPHLVGPPHGRGGSGRGAKSRAGPVQPPPRTLDRDAKKLTAEWAAGR